MCWLSLLRLAHAVLHPGSEHRNDPVCSGLPLFGEEAGSLAMSLLETPRLLVGLHDPMLRLSPKDWGQAAVTSMGALKSKPSLNELSAMPWAAAIWLLPRGISATGETWKGSKLSVGWQERGSREMPWRSESRNGIRPWRAGAEVTAWLTARAGLRQGLWLVDHRKRPRFSG